MFILFTFLLFVFVSTTFNCIRLVDVVYICAAALPCLMYYRRKSQINLLLMHVNVYTISQLAVYWFMQENVNLSGTDSNSVFIVGDNTMLVNEYVEYISDSTRQLSLMFVVAIFALMQLVYFSFENSSLMKQCNDTKTYSNVLRVLRDRLYSLKVMSCAYVLLTMCMFTYRLSKYVEASTIWRAIFTICILMVAYIIVGSLVNSEWLKTCKEMLEKEKKEKDLQEISC